MRIFKAYIVIFLGLLVIIFYVGIMTLMFSFIRYSPEEKSNWPSVIGTIVNVSVSESSPNDRAPTNFFTHENWDITVWFEYKVNNVRYKTYQMWSETESSVNIVKSKYIPGIVVPIHFNLDDPKISVVEVAKSFYSVADWILLLLILGFGSLTLAIPLIVGGIKCLHDARSSSNLIIQRCD